jgi:hypothetical protein
MSDRMRIISVAYQNKNEVGKMKMMGKKEGSFYNNKLMVASVLVLVIAGLAWVVFAAVTSVTLNDPDDNAIDWNGGLQDFNCTMATGGDTYNLTLWHNFSGTWGVNITVSNIATAGSEVNLTLNLSPMPDFTNKTWTCVANISVGTLTWGATNRTFSLDQTAPTAFSLENATSAGSAVLNNTVVRGAVNSLIVLNWSATTEVHFINYTVLVYNSTTYTAAYLVAVNKTTDTATTDVNVSPLAGGNFTDGTYYWYVKAYENDSAGRAERNSTEQVMQFIIDTVLTAATLNAPGNNTWTNNASVTFNYTVRDAHADACIIYYNITGASSFIAGNLTTGLVNGANITNTTTLSNGNYTWYVECNDTGGNRGNSTQRIFMLDATTPTIDFAGGTAANNSFLNQNYIYVNVTANDTYESNITFYLYNGSNALVSNVTSTSRGRSNNFTSLSQGLYFYNVTIVDNAGNINNTLTRWITLDTTYPVVAISSGAESNNAYVGRNWVYFNVSITEANFSNITYYIYNSTALVSNITNTTITENSVNFSGLSDGVHYYNATVVDKASLSNSTATRNITVDTTSPTEPTLGNILLGGVYYGNNTLGSVVQPTVNWTNVTEINFANYTLQFANTSNFGEANITISIRVTDKTNKSVALSTGLVNNLTYYWRVVAHDLAGNRNNSGAFSYTTDFVNVSIYPFLPSSSSTAVYFNTAYVEFKYNITDANPDTCKLYTNITGTWNATLTNSSLGTQRANYTINMSYNLNNGTFIWNVWCNDTARPSNANWMSSTNYTIIVDTAKPVITTSINATRTINRVISFTVTAGGNTAVNQSSIRVTPNASASSNLNYSNDCTSSNNGFTYTCSYIETGLTGGETNILKIDANSTSVVAATQAHLYITPTAAKNYTLALKSGWNLISTPLILTNSSINNIVANNSYIDTIYWYNNSGSTYNVWYKDSSYTDTLTTMEPRKGYWINATANTNIYFFGNYWASGSPSAYDALSLATGWHTIGQYKTTISDGFNTSQVLGNLVTSGYYDFSSLWYWDATNQLPLSATQSRDVIATAGYAIDSVWNRGRAFWLYRATSGSDYAGG